MSSEDKRFNLEFQPVIICGSVFVITCVISVLTSIMIICSQAIKAASTNPVESLRNE
jgi:hypothetical protein